MRAGLARSTDRLAAESSNEDRYERLDLDFHQKLRQGFLNMAEQDTARFCVIDAERSEDEIADEIKNELNKRMGMA